MNPAIKAKWVSALRSGAYRQGKGTLKDEEGRFCCLGVLCDLAVRDGVELEVEDHAGFTTYNDHEALPPEAVVQWAGLSNPNPSVGSPASLPINLSALNDRGYLFTTIANLIEEQL